MTARTGAACDVSGCGRPAVGRGYCIAHYRRWQRQGSPRADVPVGPRRARADLDRDRAVRLYRAGASAPGIARLLGASRSAVYAALRDADVPMRPPGHRSTPAELITDLDQHQPDPPAPTQHPERQ